MAIRQTRNVRMVRNMHGTYINQMPGDGGDWNVGTKSWTAKHRRTFDDAANKTINAPSKLINSNISATYGEQANNAVSRRTCIVSKLMTYEERRWWKRRKLSPTVMRPGLRKNASSQMYSCDRTISQLTPIERDTTERNRIHKQQEKVTVQDIKTKTGRKSKQAKWCRGSGENKLHKDDRKRCGNRRCISCKEVTWQNLRSALRCRLSCGKMDQRLAMISENKSIEGGKTYDGRLKNESCHQDCGARWVA